MKTISFKINKIKRIFNLSHNVKTDLFYYNFHKICSICKISIFSADFTDKNSSKIYCGSLSNFKSTNLNEFNVSQKVKLHFQNPSSCNQFIHEFYLFGLFISLFHRALLIPKYIINHQNTP